MNANGVREVSLGTIWEVLRRRKHTVLIGMLVASAAAALYAFSQPDRYRAEVLMSVEPAAAQDYLKPADYAPPINVQERLWLIRENLFGPSVLEQTIEEFHLYPTKDEPQELSTKLIKMAVETSRALGLSLFREATEQEKRELELDRIKSDISIQVEAADAFSIGFEGNDRKQATDVTNRMAELLVQRTARVSEQRAGSAAGFLEAETDRVKTTLDQQNAGIQAYQRQVSDQLPAQLATHLKLLETLEAQLLAKREQLANEQARRAAVLQEMKELSSQGVLEARESLSPNALRLRELRARLKELQTKYTLIHPEVKATESEIKNLETIVAADPATNRVEPTPSQLRYMQLKAEQEAIDRRLDSYQKQEQALIPQIAEYKRKIQATPQHERALTDLTRDYELTRTQYQSLLEKQNRAQLEERLEQTTQSTLFQIVRPAQVPLEPFAPKRGRIVLLGLLSGLALGLLVALVAEYRDTTYKNVEDVRETTTLPILAVIPTLPGTVKKAPHKPRASRSMQRNNVLTLRVPSASPAEQIVTLVEPRSVSSEQYGFLSMQIRQLMEKRPSGVVAVTSAAGGEGKTVTSINLSVMLSRTRAESVLLLECDLRKPRVHEYLGLSQSRGLSDLLRKPDEPLEPYLHKVGQLTVLLGGSPLSNPLETLSSDRTRVLFARLRREFQYVVLDVPPILPVADSRILADLADGVILVVRAQQTPRELFQHALGRFDAPNILGIVLNGVDLRRSPYAYAYDYYAEEHLGKGNRKASLR